MFASPFSVLFKIGAYEVKMYGIMMFLAILAGIFVSLFIAKKFYKNISSDTLLDFFPFLILVFFKFFFIKWLISLFSFNCSFFEL